MNNDLSGHYILMNDINCAETKQWNEGKGFNPIGLLFSGSFDGRGSIIKNLYINRPDEDRVGLFNTVSSSAEIKNTGLVRVKITGGSSVGGLVSTAWGASTIERCFVAGGMIKGFSNCGGLIGSSVDTDIVVKDSYTTVNVSAHSAVGGLIGYNNGGEISSCYSAGNVFVSGYTGGALVGRDEQGNESYHNCFTVGRVFCSGSTSQQIVGYIVGYTHHYPVVENSFWLDTPHDCAVKCTGAYEHECDTNIQHRLRYFMQSNNEPLASWDFIDTWDIYEGKTLPFLK
jgi:hypothetical protein